MESGWLVNNNLSRREGAVPELSVRSYQISPMTPPSWPASDQGNRSMTPQGFDNARARARSMTMTLPDLRSGQRFSNRNSAPNVCVVMPAARTDCTQTGAGYRWKKKEPRSALKMKEKLWRSERNSDVRNAPAIFLKMWMNSDKFKVHAGNSAFRCNSENLTYSSGEVRSFLSEVSNSIQINSSE